MAAGSYGTVTTDTLGNILHFTHTWLSDGAGAVTQSQTEAEAEGVLRLEGRLARVKLIPDTGGTIPDDNYDVTILDNDGFDLLEGNGTNMTQVGGNDINYDPLKTFECVPRIQVSGAGATNGGTIWFYFLRGR